MLKDLIPLIQSALWPLVTLVVVASFGTTLRRVLVAVVARIEKGDPFEVGSGGVKLGSGLKPEGVPVKELLKTGELPHPIYLVHRTRRARDLDKDQLEYYRIRVWLDADRPELLDGIDKVVYRLHPTFRIPVRTVDDRDSDYALATAGWGQFNLWAELTFKDGSPALRLERYISF